MSIEAVTLPLEEYAPTIPFCDKKFKHVRLIAEYVSRTCLALIYIIAAGSSWIFNAKTSHHYCSLAQLEFSRSIKWSSYLDHGNEIIDFSVNCLTHAHEPDLELFKMRFGAEEVDRIYKMLFPDDGEKMERKSRGCCWGMSMDFIASYLEQMEEGKTSLEAAQCIAPHFASGITDRAEVSQIFYPGCRMGRDDFFRRCDMEALYQALGERDGVSLIRDVPFYNEVIHPILHLHSEKPVVHVMDKFVEVGPTFENFIEDIPEGSYEITIYFKSWGKDVAHSIAFIKTSEEKHVIFDPNVGTLAIDRDQSADRLEKVLNRYISKDTRMIFTPFTLE
jgi:hypothetical protein